jgi:peptide deformylase
MAIRKIIRMGHPVLRKEGKKVPIKNIKSPEIVSLIKDMHETMKSSDGIGLAAPQIGESLQLAIIEIPEDSPRYPGTKKSDLLIIFNPKVTILDKKNQGYWEGCLSLPGLRGYVERPRKIRVDFLNENGEEVSLKLEGFLSTVFQHEIDHIFGKLYVDRMKDPKKFSFTEEYDKYHSDEGENFSE